MTRGEPAQSSGAKAGAAAGAEAARSRGGSRRSGRDADGGSPRWRRGGGRLAALLGAVLGATFVLMLSSHLVGPGGRGAALLRGLALYSAAALPGTPSCLRCRAKNKEHHAFERCPALKTLCADSFAACRPPAGTHQPAARRRRRRRSRRHRGRRLLRARARPERAAPAGRRRRARRRVHHRRRSPA